MTPQPVPEQMPDGTSRSGLSQGVVTELVRERADALVEIERLRHQLAGAVAALEHIGNTVVLFGADVSLDWILERARTAADAVTDPKDKP